MKKLLKLITSGIFLIVWTYIYLTLSGLILIYFWNFNFFSKHSWMTIYQYWENGGIIYSWKDYTLIILLLCYLPLWYLGWKKAKKIDWISIILWPINKYNQKIMDKYEDEIQHLTIKNMGTSDVKIEEQIEMMSKPKVKIETDAEVKKIRSAVSEKISSVKHE